MPGATIKSKPIMTWFPINFGVPKLTIVPGGNR